MPPSRWGQGAWRRRVRVYDEKGSVEVAPTMEGGVQLSPVSGWHRGFQQLGAATPVRIQLYKAARVTRANTMRCARLHFQWSWR
jgi:hypothetical protein